MKKDAETDVAANVVDVLVVRNSWKTGRADETDKDRHGDVEEHI